MPALALPSGAIIAVGSGTRGLIRCGRGVVMTIMAWRVVISPTTHLPTLFADGATRRYWVENPPMRLAAHLIPAPTPYRLGQKRKPPPRPFVLVGRVHSISATQIVLSEGEIHAAVE